MPGHAIPRMTLLVRNEGPVGYLQIVRFDGPMPSGTVTYHDAFGAMA
ncbi:GCN5 family acetyltransferase [Pandoraea apista]|uniref:GCN5 family acetyltransferase n=1 Tax=Pandoraea apista TaxID=93218 RepID=A0A5E5P106_9BURK|nr:GCN5 family acetyltransferase [Pandoraea apista]